MKLVFHTNENLEPQQKANISCYFEKLIYLCMLWEPTQDNLVLEALAKLPPLTQEKGSKSPAQRLRGCLWVLWDKEGRKGDFEAFYCQKMENSINALKEQLN